MTQTEIKYCHTFRYQEQIYSINIEDMAANLINNENVGLFQAEKSPLPAACAPHNEKNLPEIAVGTDQTQDTARNYKSEPYPVVNLILFLTQSCNLRCVYCYGDGGQYGEGGDMDEATAYRSVDWLIQQSGKRKNIYIGFFGGEPFLRFPLLKKVVAYAKEQAAAAEKMVGFHATSNGTLFNEEIITFVKKENILISVSIDGPKEVQDSQRPYANGEGSYDSIVPKIKKLLAAMPQTLGHAVLVGDTSAQLVKEALQELGFTAISMTLASQSQFIDQAHPKKPFHDTEHLLWELEQEADKWLQYINRRDADALKSIKKISRLYDALRSLLHNSKRWHSCGAGFGLVAVSVAGDLYLCQRFVGQNDYKIGSVFEDLLNREAYQQSLIAGAVCADCFAKYYCAGGCKYDNVIAHGSIFIPAEKQCTLKRKELELAAYIVCNLTDEDKDYLIDQEIFMPKPCPFDF